MGSLFGGPQTIPTTQQTAQNVNQQQQQNQAFQTAQTSTQSQTTAANPLAQAVGGNIWNMLQGIASYGSPTGQGIGPLGGAFMNNGTPQAPGNSYIPWLGTADITPQGQEAIQALTTSGMGVQPLIGQGQQYLGQGTGYMGQGADIVRGTAQPITSQDINAFYNPFASNVTANLQDIFGQQNLASRLGSTIQGGGVGAGRAAIGQALLGKQQGLAAGQIYSDLYQRALQAAQQQKQQQLAAGTG